MLKYQFNFKPDVPFEEIDSTLVLATLAAECIHGRTQIHLDASFQAHRKDNFCWVNADSEVGKHIAQIFTGLIVRLFGEQSFKIERIVGDPIEANATTSTQGVAA